jgi:uncharacterized membrane protein
VELLIARLLLGGTIVGIVLIAVGVTLMAANGIDPTAATFPALDAGRLGGDLVALRPDAFLWTGILVLVATPIFRVTGELVAFSIRRDLLMTAIAAGILAVIALSVVAALALEA